MDFFIFLIFLFLLFLIFLLLILPYFCLGFFFFEWDFLGLKFNFFFNSLLFSLILLLITLVVFLYSTYYLNSELWFFYYCLVLLVFVSSMFMLNFSNGIFSMMLSWDLLGISSFFLVLFYSNWDSNSGSMNTAMVNRIGDFFMFCFFSGSFFFGFYFFSYSFFISGFFVLLLITSFTKSAQFPFSSWLPKAMSAPTPVSSLVHSSTLVTAGLILLMNFDYLILNFFFMFFMSFVGMFTMFFSSVLAMFEEDMKKVVALSTLSQMGFLMLSLGFGLHFLSFMHLVSHALFKSCLFMQIGYLIHVNFGQQDGRFYVNSGGIPIFMQLQLLVTLFCLCGLFFTSGMVSKDLVLEFFFSNSVFFFLSLFFIVSVFLTFCYSYRLWKSFFMCFSGVLGNLGGSVVFNFLSLLLVFFSVVFLYWLSINMLFFSTVFLFLDFYLPVFFLITSLFIFFFVFKFLFNELVYKFFLDYYVKFFTMLRYNFKFVDLGVSSFGYNFFSSLIFFGKFSSLFMSSLRYNSLVFLIFFLFLFL